VGEHIRLVCEEA